MNNENEISINKLSLANRTLAINDKKNKKKQNHIEHLNILQIYNHLYIDLLVNKMKIQVMSSLLSDLGKDFVRVSWNSSFRGFQDEKS